MVASKRFNRKELKWSKSTCFHVWTLGCHAKAMRSSILDTQLSLRKNVRRKITSHHARFRYPNVLHGIQHFLWFLIDGRKNLHSIQPITRWNIWNDYTNLQNHMWVRKLKSKHNSCKLTKRLLNTRKCNVMWIKIYRQKDRSDR